MTQNLAISVQGATDVGKVRSTNQDAYLIEKEQGLYIVADGMGGHAGGEIASSLCIESIGNYFKSHDLTTADEQEAPNTKLLTALSSAINHASARIYETALEQPNLKGMGTTATVITFDKAYAYVGHVGDSRLYLYRSGFLYQMTYDHSLVSEQVRAGVLSKEEAELHHLRNVITRSVGYQEEEDVDTRWFALESEDYLIACSDGLHGKVSNKELTKMIDKLGVSAVQPLITLANERGGDDNITVIIIKVQVLS